MRIDIYYISKHGDAILYISLCVEYLVTTRYLIEERGVDPLITTNVSIYILYMLIHLIKISLCILNIRF